MTAALLAINAGSSSLKLRVVDDNDEVTDAIDLPGDFDPKALRQPLTKLGQLSAIGHRFVHGGSEFSNATFIDSAVREKLVGLAGLAPLHQPKAIAALDATLEIWSDIPAVACFDTSFHSKMPRGANTYALPEEWRNRWPLRRFGFHGLSHAYASRVAAQMIGEPSARIVTCHLGAGASLAAVRGGRSVDTTMGFTPLEGLVMATRSGSVDPGLLLWLLEHEGMPLEELSLRLRNDSGLKGLAGTPDMAVILHQAEIGDDGSRLALEVYLHSLRAGIASMAAALEGLDALVFTGGIGENSATIRARACEGLKFLGIELDLERNESIRGDGEIGSGRVRSLVIEAREELEIAHETREHLSTRRSRGAGN